MKLNIYVSVLQSGGWIYNAEVKSVNFVENELIS